MKYNENEFIPGMSSQEIAMLKQYCKKHDYNIDWKKRLITDKQGCHSAFLIKDNNGHICAVNDGIKEDITDNVTYSKYIATRFNLKLTSSLMKGLEDVFGLVSLTHTKE